MADDAPEPKSGGNAKEGGAKGFITKKVGPLPVWGWVAIGATVVLFLRARAKSAAAATNASASGSNITTPALGPPDLSGTGYATGSGDPTLDGFIAQLEQLQAQQQASGPSLTSEVGPSSGSGYTSLSPNQVINTSAGSFTPVLGTALPALLQQGIPVFFQDAPGNFIPWTPTTPVSNGTQLFQQVPTGTNVGVQYPSSTSGGAAPVAPTVGNWQPASGPIATPINNYHAF